MLALTPKNIYFIANGGFTIFRDIGFLAVAVFYIQNLGLNPLQLVLVGTVVEVTCFLLEIPTGVVADTFSRKLSVCIGLFLVGVHFLVQVIFPNYSAVLLSQVIAGAGWTFISGALDAWAVDEIGETNAGKLFLQAFQVNTVCGIIGTGAGMAFGAISYELAIAISGSMTIALALFLLIIMPENGFKPQRHPATHPLKAMTATFGKGFALARASRLVVFILLIGIIFGAFSEAFDRLWQARFINEIHLPEMWNLSPIVWFGLIGLLMTPISLGSSWWLSRRMNTENPTGIAKMLLVINAGLMISIFLFSLAWNFPLGMLAFMLIGLFRGLTTPLYSAWLNQQVTTEVRATVLSMGSQADALGQFLGGPALGYLASTVSIAAAIGVSGLLLLPALALYIITLRPAKTVAETTS